VAGSLFDQLKKTGLVDEKKAKKIKHEKHQQAKKQKANKAKKGQIQKSEATQLAEQAAEEKRLRDLELNQKRQQAKAEKAKQAELKQIIQSNQLKNFKGDIAYNFADGDSVKTLHINAKTQQGLARATLIIIHFENAYAIVSNEVIDRILQRDPNALVQGKSQESELSEEDKAYYDKFAIPDDLVW